MFAVVATKLPVALLVNSSRLGRRMHFSLLNVLRESFSSPPLSPPLSLGAPPPLSSSLTPPSIGVPSLSVLLFVLGTGLVFSRREGALTCSPRTTILLTTTLLVGLARVVVGDVLLLP
jgi:hypothetical protein